MSARGWVAIRSPTATTRTSTAPLAIHANRFDVTSAVSVARSQEGNSRRPWTTIGRYYAKPTVSAVLT